MEAQTKVFAVKRKKESLYLPTDFDKIHCIWDLTQTLIKLLQCMGYKVFLQMNLG